MLRLKAYWLVVAIAFLPAVAVGGPTHVTANFHPLQGYSVAGHVDLTQLPEGGTKITLTATGLRPGVAYFSLYNEKNGCVLGQNSAGDVVGQYRASAGGVATITARVVDDLDSINSVSIRLASDFTLEACAVIH
jgi:hypothetical protein